MKNNCISVYIKYKLDEGVIFLDVLGHCTCEGATVICIWDTNLILPPATSIKPGHSLSGVHSYCI